MTSYLDMANAAAVSYGIPPDLFAAQVGVESAWNPNAIGSSGELGLAQVMPATGNAMGYTNLMLSDPQGGLNAGAQYLSQQYAKFGNWPQALSSYNAGSGGTSTAGGLYAAKVLNAASGTSWLDSFKAATAQLLGGAKDLGGKRIDGQTTFSWLDPATWWPEIMKGLVAKGVPVGFFLLGLLLILAGIYGAIVKGEE